MVARVSPKVQASFEANCFLHSAAVLEQTHVIEGTDMSLSEKILSRFRDEGIKSSTENLESELIKVYSEMREFEVNEFQS